MSAVESLVEAAQNKDDTPFDYIVVGSGPGGGPMACRLALAGKRVLLLEAGGDPLKAPPSRAYPGAAVGEATRIPCFYASASEDAEMSWMFSVRHYRDTERQKLDAKYNQTPFDPNRPPGTSDPLDPKYLDPHPKGGKQGIFYPRSSAIGGCTSHHAMIVIAPNIKDWNYIADLTGDDSWLADRMHPYFAKLERNLYLNAYAQYLRKFLGIFYKIWRWLASFFRRDDFVENGGHGFKGWQPTSFIDPFLVQTIAKSDMPFFKAIARAALAVLHGNYSLIAMFKRAILQFRLVEQIDFNDVNTRLTSPEGVFLIPIGTESDKVEYQDGQVIAGTRSGLREFLLRTQKEVPDKLVIVTGAHVTRVLFEKKTEDQVPRAVGVEAVMGDHLYEASPMQKPVPANSGVRFFTRGEVILSGGSFNTPQLLMLSGIGDVAHLAEHGIHHLSGVDGEPLDGTRRNESGEKVQLAPVVNLPGIGRNMQDRYEVTVISELNKELASLNKVSFKPGDPNDPARARWLRGEKGLYATNGGTLAIIRRSSALREDEPEPDLFTFAASAGFRGYYWNWSRELLRGTIGGGTEDKPIYWSWVILKAYTRNNGGTVRLRSADPFSTPEICFHSFDETPGDGWKKDLAAVVDAVRFIRRVNSRNSSQFVHEIQPGRSIADDSPEMEEWIKTQAWGHHACGTCRIGSDAWNPDPEKLTDRGAVLDSRFRVHGVTGLRVVDASVFPKIPGYFILAPILMVSEKAADVLLQDATIPSALKQTKWEDAAQSAGKDPNMGRYKSYVVGVYRPEEKRPLVEWQSTASHETESPMHIDYSYPVVPNHPDVRFQGSTEFYLTPTTDPFTPSYLEAKPLIDNVGTPWGKDECGNHIYPPWMRKRRVGESKPPWQMYVEWFNGIWHTGDPTEWNRDVFTNTATNIDPTGITRGAEQGAALFRLLFRFFPDLRGEVVSWSANEREIFINWRFRIPNTKNKQPIGPITQFLSEQQAGRDFLVPVVDKFCFAEGRVSYRVAYFDIITLTGYLSETYGGNQLYDFLIAFFWQSTYSGGIVLFLRMIINGLLGLFVWPKVPAASTLYASPGNGVVLLKWVPVKGAVKYEVTRAPAIDGLYNSPRKDGVRVFVKDDGSGMFRTYEDQEVVNGAPYWYLVRPIFKEWEPEPVSRVEPDPEVRRRARNHVAV